MRRLFSCVALAVASTALGDSPATPGAAAAAEALTPIFPPLPYITGPGIQEALLASDETWGLLVLESEQKCGKACTILRDEFAAFEAKAGGIFKFAYTHGSDIILGSSGALVEVRQQFNLTEIPALIIYPAGPKRMDRGLTLGAESVMALVGRGHRVLFQNLRMFVASLVSSVRTTSFGAWLGRPLAPVPRVLLFSDKTESSLQYKMLSLQAASTAVLGQALPSDAALAAAFGVTKGPALFVSSPFPRAAAAALLPEGSSTVDDAKLAKLLPPGSLGSSWTPFPGNLSTATYADLGAFVAAHAPSAAVPVLTGPADFEKYCGTGAADVTVCFIAVLPHEAVLQARAYAAAGPGKAISEAEAEELRTSPDAWPALLRVASRAYLRTDWEAMQMGRGALEASRLPLTFVIVDASTQAGFAASLKASSAPALVALNPRKKVFAALRGGAFSGSAMHGFVMSVMDQAAAGSMLGNRGAPAAAHPGPGGKQKHTEDEDEESGEGHVTLESLAEVPVLKQEAVPASRKPKAPAAGKKAGAAAVGKKAAAAKLATGGKKPAAAAAAAKPAAPASDGSEGGASELGAEL